MAPSEDLIDFGVIEAQKENIQSLPGGRSAKKLVDLFSPSPLHKLSTPTPSDTKNVNDCIRAEYEAEVATISESDDPLDVFDRYVRWTLDAYPAAQATPQSQLHLLLERATKAFIGSNQYKNDPRYMKMWLHYIQLFSDTPRETFMYLSRHGVGEGLALFYEEYAAWLESAGRWAQAEEVYKLGIEREARPQQRLIRKFGEFEQRRAQVPEEQDTPSSPALPTVRPALAAKVDPFAAAAAAARDPQAPRQHSGVGGLASKPGKSKMAIFSDADAAAPAVSSRGPDSKGWDNIGSLADRKKENTMEPKPWAGETLAAGGKKSNAKMAVFRDPSLVKSHITIHPSQYQMTVNPASGKRERVFVNLEVVYPTPEEPGTELSFEEIWAANRGLLNCVWARQAAPLKSRPVTAPQGQDQESQVDLLAGEVSRKLVVHSDVVRLDENGMMIKDQPQTGRPKKKKVAEVNETQIIKAKLDSPSGPRIKKRQSVGGSSEPTMTMHTKAATDDIYDIFNQPLQPVAQEEDRNASDDDYETDGDYTTDGGESTGTTRQIATSEAGDEEDEDAVMTDADVDAHEVEDTSDIKSVSEWSEFSTGKHLPSVANGQANHNQDAQIDDEIPEDDEEMSEIDVAIHHDENDDEYDEDFQNPDNQELPPPTRTSFVPIPPEDYSPPKRPYRDPAEVANNRLPFMTPITERTEHTLGFDPQYSDGSLNARTPSKGYRKDIDTPPDSDGDLVSSPLIENVRETGSPSRIARPAQPFLRKADPAAVALKALAPKGPIIEDLQINPMEENIRKTVLSHAQLPLSSQVGFFNHHTEKYERGSEIRKYAKSIAQAQKGRRRSDRSSGEGLPVVVQFADLDARYTIKRELGAGAFAPVYLVENSDPHTCEEQNGDENAPVVMGKGAFATASTKRSALEALKMEAPPTAWEFHMMRLTHSRLGPQHRATASMMPALECHLYQDEAFLFLPLQPHGTLLDVVNLYRAENQGNTDELLAMFFAIELFRLLEALHAKQIIHGDVKADNCLLRLDPLSEWSPDNGQLSSQYHADGSGGWGARGATLIDFGRAIDMRAFTRDVTFVADWKPTVQDCAEIREGRPWTWQIDYYGLASILYVLLFGKHIETVRCDDGGLGTGAGRRYRVRDSLKRYWQTDIWQAAFDLLLNPGAYVEAEEGARMPVLRGMKGVRESMEMWLEKNCEKGVGLKSLLAKVEAGAKARREKVR